LSESTVGKSDEVAEFPAAPFRLNDTGLSQIASKSRVLRIVVFFQVIGTGLALQLQPSNLGM
jgi:hypothetical protein